MINRWIEWMEQWMNGWHTPLQHKEEYIEISKNEGEDLQVPINGINKIINNFQFLIPYSILCTCAISRFSYYLIKFGVRVPQTVC